MSRPTTLLGPLDDLTAEEINVRFNRLVAGAELGTLPALDDGAFAALVAELQTRPKLFTFADLFCGSGGSAIGYTMAGGLLMFAANHSKRNIETHQANFPDAEHECADINHYDMRNIPYGADVLHASPICTELSPAGGNSSQSTRKGKAKPRPGEQHGAVSKDQYERTRATFHDVVRATEIHMFKYVVVENVVEAAWKWKMFGWWLDGMVFLGYGYQIVSVSAAHVGDALNPHAPQRRDRMYVVFHRLDMPKPDLELHPISWCETCGPVEGVQDWKKPGGTLTKSGRYFRVGKYGRNGQYVYRCPNVECLNSVVTPMERPAAAVIDWSDLGTVIADRDPDDQLAANTMRRIEKGFQMFARPVTVAAAGNTYERPGSGYVRAWPADQTPFMAQQCTSTTGMACPPVLDVPPFLVKNYSDGGRPQDRVRPTGEAFGTVTTGRNASLVCPPYVVNTNHDDDRIWPVGGRSMPAATTRIGDSLVVPPGAFVDTVRQHVLPTSVHEALTTVSAQGNHHGLVVPYNRTGIARPAAGNAFPTQTTHDRCGLAVDSGTAPFDVMQARYRMIQWHEQARAQRFPASYKFTGNAGEITAGVGNAVASNVTAWIGAELARCLNRTAAHV